MFRNNKNFLIIIVFIIIANFRNFIFWSDFQTFIFGDTAIHGLYQTAFASHFNTIFSIKNNFLFWNPSYLSVGLPTLSNINMGVLYPPNILIAFISNLLGDPLLAFPLYTISIFTHVAFGSFFVYKIAKSKGFSDRASLVGGLFWAFSGFNTELLTASAILLAGSYLPFCFYMRLKFKRGKLTKEYYLYFLTLSFSFLAGYPIVSITIHLICVAFSFFVSKRPKLIRFIRRELVGFFLITLPIASPLYFSVVVNFPLSVRASSISLDSVLNSSASPTNLTESLFHINTPVNNSNNLNQVYVYLSAIGILSLFQVRKIRNIFNTKFNKFLVLLGVFGLIMTFGKWTLLPTILYYIVPLFSFFRNLSFFSIIPAFVFSLIVAWALNEKSRKITPLSKAFFGALLNLLVLILLTSFTKQSVIQNTYITFIVIFLGFVAFYYYQKTVDAKTLYAILLAAVLIEATFLTNSKTYANSKVSPKDVFKQNKVVNALVANSQQLDRVEVLQTQHNYSVDHAGLEQTAGYLSLASSYGSKINEELTLSKCGPENIRDLLGVSYIVSSKELSECGWETINKFDQGLAKTDFYYFNYESLSWEPMKSDTVFTIYKRPKRQQRLFLASSVEEHPQTSQVLKELSKEQDPTKVYVSDNYKQITPSKEDTITISEYSRNYIKAHANVKGQAFVANSTGYYPGWWAKVNGKWQKPTQTNWFMQGIHIPEGESVIEFIYIPYGIIAGGIYITIVLILWLIYFVFLTKKSNLKFLSD